MWWEQKRLVPPEVNNGVQGLDGDSNGWKRAAYCYSRTSTVAFFVLFETIETFPSAQKVNNGVFSKEICCGYQKYVTVIGYNTGISSIVTERNK